MRSAAWRAASIGALFAALVTLPGLGTGTLWDNSETAYGEVAREIGLTGDWVVMHLNAQPWFVQPPLYFWIAALFAKVLGLSAFALRLPSALATIAMGGAVGYATARIAGTRAGIVASVVLSTALMQAILGRLAIMDALLDLTVTGAILWGYRAFEPVRADDVVPAVGRHDLALILGAAALALGTLAKGPVAPVIAGLVLVPWLIWERLAGRVIVVPRAAAIVAAVAVYLLIAAPWFIALAARVGGNGLGELIGHYTVGRYTGVIENQRGPWWYYLPALILGFFPWIAFVPVAAWREWREARTPSASFARLSLVWAIVPLLFFSAAQTKLPNYIALMLPALAILCALWFDRVADGRDRRAAIVSAATVPFFVVCVGFAIAVFTRENNLGPAMRAVGPSLEVLGIGMIAGSVGTVVAFARRSWTDGAPYVLAVTAGLLVLFIAIVAEPVAESLKPMPRFAKVIDAQRRPGDAVAVRGVSGGNALVFYTAPEVATVADDDAAYYKAICPGGRVFLVTRAGDAENLAVLARRVQRTATVLDRTPRAALLRIDGRDCPHD